MGWLLWLANDPAPAHNKRVRARRKRARIAKRKQRKAIKAQARAARAPMQRRTPSLDPELTEAARVVLNSLGGSRLRRLWADIDSKYGIH